MSNYRGLNVGVGVDAIGGEAHLFLEGPTVHPMGNIWDDLGNMFNDLFDEMNGWLFGDDCP